LIGIEWSEADLDKFGIADGEMYDLEGPLSHKAISDVVGARSRLTDNRGWVWFGRKGISAKVVDTDIEERGSQATFGDGQGSGGTKSTACRVSPTATGLGLFPPGSVQLSRF